MFVSVFDLFGKHHDFRLTTLTWSNEHFTYQQGRIIATCTMNQRATYNFTLCIYIMVFGHIILNKHNLTGFNKQHQFFKLNFLRHLVALSCELLGGHCNSVF